VQRIHQKKELGCKAATYHTIEEGKSSAKESAFWEILGGKKLSHGELASCCCENTCARMVTIISLLCACMRVCVWCVSVHARNSR